MEKEKIDKILSEHLKWIQDKDSGKQANLEEVDLSDIYLDHVNLSGANLRQVDLSSASLEYVDLVILVSGMLILATRIFIGLTLGVLILKALISMV